MASVVGVETAAAAGAGASAGAAAKPAMISASNAISGVAMMPPALSMTRTRHRRASLAIDHASSIDRLSQGEKSGLRHTAENTGQFRVKQH
jgi:hypothetical protein